MCCCAALMMLSGGRPTETREKLERRPWTNKPRAPQTVCCVCVVREVGERGAVWKCGCAACWCTPSHRQRQHGCALMNEGRLANFRWQFAAWPAGEACFSRCGIRKAWWVGGWVLSCNVCCGVCNQSARSERLIPSMMKPIFLDFASSRTFQIQANMVPTAFWHPKRNFCELPEGLLLALTMSCS